MIAIVLDAVSVCVNQSGGQQPAPAIDRDGPCGDVRRVERRNLAVAEQQVTRQDLLARQDHVRINQKLPTHSSEHDMPSVLRGHEATSGSLLATFAFWPHSKNPQASSSRLSLATCSGLRFGRGWRQAPTSTPSHFMITLEAGM